jgi:hypothetical protein
MYLQRKIKRYFSNVTQNSKRKSFMKIKREGPCRNRGRLPKLTAYEKIEI